MSIDGQRCVEIEFAPHTAEGHAVMSALLRWGVWKRAGMSGMITGLDMMEAMSAIPAECDHSFAHRLFSIAEAAFCAAHIETNKVRSSDG